MAMEDFRNLDKYEKEDYYFNEEGYLVFTRTFLLKRGYCCESGCTHCPYGNSGKKIKKEGFIS